MILRCDNFAIAKNLKETSIRGDAMHTFRAVVDQETNHRRYNETLGGK